MDSYENIYRNDYAKRKTSNEKRNNSALFQFQTEYNLFR